MTYHKNQSPRLPPHPAVLTVILLVLGSRGVFLSVLATVLLVLLNSTPTSATPVAAAGLSSSGDVETVHYPVLERRKPPKRWDQVRPDKTFKLHPCIPSTTALACNSPCALNVVRNEETYKCVWRNCQPRMKRGTDCPAAYYDYRFTIERRTYPRLPSRGVGC